MSFIPYSTPRIVSGAAVADVAEIALGSERCVAALIQASSLNANSVFIGSEASRDIELVPGASTVLPVRDIGLVWIEAAAPSDVSYLVFK